jgi:Acetylornithine deacetylase/Succinyl-diaminopimelate desuccinylase and related deacylases
MNKTLELTKQLVAIPSWVGPGCDEGQIGEFVYNWLRKNTQLTVIKQQVKDDRFNVIATGQGPTRSVLVGHMDTVEPRAGWLSDPWTPVIKNDRLFGLGATDMKGSLAAMLTAVSEVKNTNGLMVLCYIDEEYDFAGMRGVFHFDFAISCTVVSYPQEKPASSPCTYAKNPRGFGLLSS